MINKASMKDELDLLSNLQANHRHFQANSSQILLRLFDTPDTNTPQPACYTLVPAASTSEKVLTLVYL
jgi:hypothetical protein